MRGSIVRRNTGYFIVYDAGKKWDEKKKQVVRKQRWEKIGVPDTRKHAEKLLSERLSELHRGDFVEPSKMTFSEFKDRWVVNYAEGQVRQSTMTLYGTLFRRHLIPFFGDFPLADIGVEDVQRFKTIKLKQKKHPEKSIGGKGKVLSPQTVKHMLRLLRQMLDHAVEWGYLRKNPAKSVKHPSIPKKEMDCLSPNEVNRLLQSTNDKWYAFVLTAVVTGMRLGELLAMKWDSFDWDKGRYFVRETVLLSREGRSAKLGQPKTDSSCSSVDLTPRCLTALKEHRKRQAEDRLKAGDKNEDSGLVFAGDRGGLLDHRNVVQRVFVPFLKAAGLRKLRFHDLRHTCASILISQGESPKYIQKQLRHASVQITFDRYGHLFQDSNQETVKRMDAAIFGGESHLTNI